MAAAAVLALFVLAGEAADEDLCSFYQRHRDIRCMETLLARYEPVVRKLALRLVRSFEVSCDYAEDAAEVMRIALLAAAERFDSGRHAGFHSFAWKVLENAGRDYLEGEARQAAHGARSLDQFESDSERETYLCRHAAGYAETRASDHEALVLFLKDIAARLPPDASVVLAIVVEGGSEGDIAARLGCSRDAARVRRSRVIAKIRKTVKKDRLEA